MDLVATERVKRRRALAYSTHACTMDITERIEGRGGVPEWREASVANRVKKGIDMPICYPRLVQTGLHQTDFPTLCWFETDRLRMGGVVRHTNTYLGVAKQVSPDPMHSMDTHRNSGILSV